MTFFHFTHIGHLPSIFAMRALVPTESNVGSPSVTMQPAGQNWGPQVVWLLDEPTITSQDERYHGLYPAKRQIRFEVNVPAIRWRDWAPAREMNPEWRSILIDTAGGPEVVDHWYVWPSVIRANRWVEVRDMVADEAIEHVEASA